MRFVRNGQGMRSSRRARLTASVRLAAPPRGRLGASADGLGCLQGLLAGPDGVTQFGELPAGPQPRQGQRRVGAAGQHGMQPRRQVLEQEPQRRMHRLGAD